MSRFRTIAAFALLCLPFPGWAQDSPASLTLEEHARLLTLDELPEVLPKVSPAKLSAVESLVKETVGLTVLPGLHATGVHIGPNLFLTNSHVLKAFGETKEIIVSSVVGSAGRWQMQTELRGLQSRGWSEPFLDLAVFQTDFPPGHPFAGPSSVRLSTEPLRLGEPIVLATLLSNTGADGKKLRRRFHVGLGRVEDSIVGIENTSFVVTNGGSNGSPVARVRPDGSLEVAGIAFGGQLPDGTHKDHLFQEDVIERSDIREALCRGTCTRIVTLSSLKRFTGWEVSSLLNPAATIDPVRFGSEYGKWIREHFNSIARGVPMIEPNGQVVRRAAQIQIFNLTHVPYETSLGLVRWMLEQKGKEASDLAWRSLLADSFDHPALVKRALGTLGRTDLLADLQRVAMEVFHGKDRKFVLSETIEWDPALKEAFEKDPWGVSKAVVLAMDELSKTRVQTLKPLPQFADRGGKEALLRVARDIPPSELLYFLNERKVLDRTWKKDDLKLVSETSTAEYRDPFKYILGAHNDVIAPTKTGAPKLKIQWENPLTVGVALVTAYPEKTIGGVIDALEERSQERAAIAKMLPEPEGARPGTNLSHALNVPADEIADKLTEKKFLNRAWNAREIIGIAEHPPFVAALTERSYAGGKGGKRLQLHTKWKNRRRFSVTLGAITDAPVQRPVTQVKQSDSGKALELVYLAQAVFEDRLKRGLPPEIARQVPIPELAAKWGHPAEETERVARTPSAQDMLKTQNRNSRDWLAMEFWIVDENGRRITPVLSDRPDLSTREGRDDLLVRIENLARRKAGQAKSGIVHVLVEEIARELPHAEMPEKNVDGLLARLRESTYREGFLTVNRYNLLHQSPLILIDGLVSPPANGINDPQLISRACEILFDKKRAYDVKEFAAIAVTPEEVAATFSLPLGSVRRAFSSPGFSTRLEAMEVALAVHDFASENGGQLQFTTEQQRKDFLKNGLLERFLHKPPRRILSVLEWPEFKEAIQTVSEVGKGELAEPIRAKVEEIRETYTAQLVPKTVQSPFFSHSLTDAEAVFLDQFNLSREEWTRVEQLFLGQLERGKGNSGRTNLLVETLYQELPKNQVAQGEAKLRKIESVQREILAAMKGEIESSLRARGWGMKQMAKGQWEFICIILVVRTYEIMRTTGKNLVEAVQDSLVHLASPEFLASIGAFVGITTGGQLGANAWVRSQWKSVLKNLGELSGPSNVRFAMRMGNLISKGLAQAAFFPGILAQRWVENGFRGNAAEQALGKSQLRANLSYFMVDEALRSPRFAGNATPPERQKRAVADLRLRNGSPDPVNPLPAGFENAFLRTLNLQILDSEASRKQAWREVSLVDSAVSTVLFGAAALVSHAIPIPYLSSGATIVLGSLLEGTYQEQKRVAHCRNLSADWKEEFRSHREETAPVWNRFVSVANIGWRELERRDVRTAIALESRFWGRTQADLAGCAQGVFPAALMKLMEGAVAEIALAGYLQSMSPPDRREYIRGTSRDAASADMFPDVRNLMISSTAAELNRISKLDPRGIASELWGVMMTARGRGALVLHRNGPSTFNRTMLTARDQVLEISDGVRQVVPQFATWLRDERGPSRILENLLDETAGKPEIVFAGNQPPARLAVQWLVQDWEQPVIEMAVSGGLMGRLIDGWLEEGNRPAFIRQMIAAGDSFREAYLRGSIQTID
ncbi:MAG: serine protease [Pseudomonadota bacterium]